jgi:hypothetical protein
MKGILCVLGCLALVVAFSSNSFARGGRGGGGDMMVCNVAQAPQPPQAKAENLVQTKATRVLQPMVFGNSESLMARKSVSGFNLSDLSSFNASPKAIEAIAPASNVASK